MKENKNKYIHYNEKIVGYIHHYNSHGADKFNIHLDGFSMLEKLCKLNSEEILEVDGMSKIKYEEFKEKILSKSEAIYPSMIRHVDFNPTKDIY